MLSTGWKTMTQGRERSCPLRPSAHPDLMAIRHTKNKQVPIGAFMTCQIEASFLNMLYNNVPMGLVSILRMI